MARFDPSILGPSHPGRDPWRGHGFLARWTLTIVTVDIAGQPRQWRSRHLTRNRAVTRWHDVLRWMTQQAFQDRRNVAARNTVFAVIAHPGRADERFRPNPLPEVRT